MPYTPINVVNGVTPLNATFGNTIQTQYAEASQSFNVDLFGPPFILEGFVATKDGTIANQLDVTAGVGYPLQSDGTLRRRSVASSNQTTSALSSTYFLYLQPDGTWYWSTTNAPAANSLAICTVTTDGSGNILAVTDARQLTTVLLYNMTGMAGVSRIVASTPAGGVHVTATTIQTVLTYAVTATGLYRVSAYIQFSNGGTAEKIVLNLNWTDPTLGANLSFFANGNQGATPVLLDASATAAIANPVAVPTIPQLIYAQAGHNITVQYQDPGGTPNDFVFVIVERLQ